LAYGKTQLTYYPQIGYGSLDFWQPFYQEKGWSPTAAASRGKKVWWLLPVDDYYNGLPRSVKNLPRNYGLLNTSYSNVRSLPAAGRLRNQPRLASAQDDN